METLVAPAINLAILVSILGYYLRQPLKGFVRTRHDTLRDEVERVGNQLKLAQAKFDEFSAKLKAIDAEVAALKEQARQDSEAMKVRVINDAKRLSQTIVTDARSSAQSVYVDLKNDLRRDLANRVLDKAEALLRSRLTGDDRIRIQREFSRQVERIQ